MKKISAILLTLALVLSMSLSMMLTASAETPSVWDGKANIKWYVDAGKGAGLYELNTAQDLHISFAQVMQTDLTAEFITTPSTTCSDSRLRARKASMQSQTAFMSPSAETVRRRLRAICSLTRW